MKISTLTGLGLFLAAAAVPASASATPFEVDGFFYEITGTNTVKVMPNHKDNPNTNGYKGDLVVPASITYNGKEYKVTAIGKEAFRNCYNVTTITLPKTIERIDSFGMSNCCSMKNFVLPGNVKVLETGALQSNRFVTFEAENGLDSIGTEAISHLGNLTSMKLPASVKSIAPGSLHYSHKLEAITIDENNPYWKSVDGVVFSKDGKILLDFPCYKDGGEQYSLPSGTKEIAPHAMSYLDRVTSIKFPYSLEKAGERAFYSCAKLVTLSGETCFKEMDKQAFSSCTKLEKFEVGYNITMLDSAVFQGSYIPQVKLSSARALKTIGKDAFNHCGLQTIDIPTAVTDIASSAFLYCTSLKSINMIGGSKRYATIDGVLYSADLDTIKFMPPGYPAEKFEMLKETRHIGEFAFYGAPVRYLTGADNVESIGRRAFYASHLTRFELPAKIDSLPYECFANTWLTSVVVPDNVKAMDGGVFSTCKYLVSAKLPDGLEEVAPGTFWACNALENVNVPASAKKIGYNSYAQCYGMKSIVIPDATEEIEYNAFNAPFNPYNSSKLESIELGKNLKVIGKLGFGGHMAVKTIKSHNPVPPTATDDVFANQIYSKSVLSVPEEALSAYKAAVCWKKFTNTDTFAGISDINADAAEGEVMVNGNAISANCEGNMAVYTISGVCIYNGIVTEVEVAQPGIYVVILNGKAVKVAVK